MNDMHDEHSSPLATSSEDPAYYAHMAAAMTHAYRLRGWAIPLVGALTCLLFAVLVPCWYSLWLDHAKPITILVIGVLPMILAIPCHVLGGNRGFLANHGEIRTILYILGIFLNAVGTSLCITAYYVHIEGSPTLAPLVAAALVSVAIYAILAILFQILPNRYGLLTGSAGLITLVLLITAIVFWVRSDSKVFFSFGFFTLLWTLITVIALHVACSDEESPWLRFASFASFGILMAVGAIVLVILACAAGGGDGCDCGCGDCCDCGDCGCGGGTSEKAAAKPMRKKRRRLGFK